MESEVDFDPPWVPIYDEKTHYVYYWNIQTDQITYDQNCGPCGDLWFKVMLTGDDDSGEAKEGNDEGEGMDEEKEGRNSRQDFYFYNFDHGFTQWIKPKKSYIQASILHYTSAETLEDEFEFEIPHPESNEAMQNNNNMNDDDTNGTNETSGINERNEAKPCQSREKNHQTTVPPHSFIPPPPPAITSQVRDVQVPPSTATETRTVTFANPRPPPPPPRSLPPTLQVTFQVKKKVTPVEGSRGDNSTIGGEISTEEDQRGADWPEDIPRNAETVALLDLFRDNNVNEYTLFNGMARMKMSRDSRWKQCSLDMDEKEELFDYYKETLLNATLPSSSSKTTGNVWS
eukprot:g2727.t1